MQVLTQTQLLERGWTKSLISTFLGRLPYRVTSRLRPSGRPLEVFAYGDVEEVEASHEFREAYARLEASRAKRRAAYHLGLATRERNAVSNVEVASDWTRAAIENHALRDWIDFRILDWQDEGSLDNPAFLARISVDYVRHHLSNFDTLATREPMQIKLAIRARVHQLIADAYPFLAKEAERQMRF